MMNSCFKILLLLLLFSCESKEKEAEFTGAWIDKSLLGGKYNTDKAKTDALAPFPLILFEKEQADSILFYYNPNQKNIYPAHYSYASYFIHFSKYKEYFLLMDYKSGEMVFSNLKDDTFYRFKKAKKPLSRAQVLDSAFNLNHFIQTLE